uniref:Glucosamine 6-phosphate N-acetyltransferase n=2 Tax=Cuerna arida TaxID=1464854 RepID=A0A1B6GCY7_9HEMI
MIQQNEDVALFDKHILDKLDFTKFKSNFNPSISVTEPGSGFLVRPLHTSDYNAGFIELLGQLTTTGDISYDEFEDTFQSMKKCPNTYFVVVIEDTTLGRVVGSSTLVLEQKFIHKCALRGRVEDVVVSNDYRGKQLGKLLIATMVLLAEQLGVYKLTLDCRDHMIPFYQAFGYKKEPGNSNYMQIRFRA